MNVIREDINAQTAILKVQVSPADYQSKVATTLDKYRKTAKIPGFRPGKVPMGMIQKQYGKAVLAEELNKIVNDSLYSYVNEQKIEILGNPIPKEDIEVKGDFNAPTEFEFAYEIGLTPKIDLKLPAKEKVDYYKVKIDDTLVNKQIDDLRRRYGKLVGSDAVGDNDLIMAQFVELNDDETIKEGGIMHSSTISVEFLEDAKTKKALTGKVVGDKIVVDPSKVSRGEKDTAAMLGITEEQLKDVSDKFQMTINEIRHMEMAELNQELFDKLFGEGTITSEKELRERISKDLENMFANDSDRILMNTMYKSLMDNTKVELPSDFLKRWIKLSNEKPITLEEIEEQFEGYEKGMKWQLIQGHIFKANDLKLEQNEVLEFTKGLLINQYAQYGLPAPADKELTDAAARVLSNKDEANRVYDMIAEVKLTDYFKNTVKLNEKMVSYDEFVEIASK
ncbi:MAG: trigger factor [Crocinitomicaceae bacterium]|jgi:trigger factor|nr:trigger factor [Crocinitomicaceae bacterium]